MRKLKAILILLLLSCSIAYSQHTASDSVKCFTIDQQKKILKKFVALDECTELRAIDSMQIARLDTALTRSYQINLMYLNKINVQHKDIDILDRKVRNRNKIIIGSVTINIAIFGLLLLL